MLHNLYQSSYKDQDEEMRLSIKSVTVGNEKERRRRKRNKREERKFKGSKEKTFYAFHTFFSLFKLVSFLLDHVEVYHKLNFMYMQEITVHCLQHRWE